MKRFVFTLFVSWLLIGCGSGVSEDNTEGKIPFKVIGHDIVVTARIDGFERDFSFIVDTGGVALLDKSVADELGLKQRGTMAKISTLDLSGYEIENVFCFTTFDFSIFKRLGTPIHGIIGSNLMERFKVTFDFQTSTLMLSTDAAALAVPDNGIYFSFRNHPVNNAPIIKLKADGKEMDGMIDTGQPYPLVLPLKDFKQIVKPEKKDIVRSKGLMIKWPQMDSNINYLKRLKTFELGSLKIKDALCIFGEPPQMLSMPLIGMDLLSQFKMIINYPGDELLLIPNPDIRFEKNLYTFGMNLNLSENNEIFVEGFWEESPADKAGILVGDIVSGFDNKKASPANLSDLLGKMEDDDVKSISLEISNQNGTRRLDLKKAVLFQ